MLKCNNCQIELKNKNQKKFCSRSCAAKHNNTLFPKKEPALTAKCKTIDCTAIVKSKSRAYCSSCIQNKKHIRGLESSESTIEELVKRTGSNRYDRIRINAHNLYKEEKKKPLCQCCGYNKHIEICHIQSIASFPKETKIKVVNAIENILFLCPNCHWEFDHDILNIEQLKVVGEVGYDPTAFRL